MGKQSELLASKRSELLLLRMGDFLLRSVGKVLERIHAPARIREFEVIDPLTDETVYLSTGERYSVLHVGNRRFFFDRITGRFDGTGTLLEKGVVDRLELLD